MENNSTLPIVYSRKDCPNCESLIDALEGMCIPFERIYIDDNYKAKAVLIAAGLDSVPVVSDGRARFVAGPLDTLVKAAHSIALENM